MFKNNLFIRNITSRDYLEILFVSAVSSILGIRFFLNATGYPQIGGGNFHIAHMLWGGILMLVSIVIFLSLLNKSALRISAIMGGIGFGAFIDEIGKLITSNNDYFFEPSIAIIYVIFVIFFLFLRFVEKDEGFSKKEYLDNAFELVKQAYISQSMQNKLDALEVLKKCDRDDPLVSHLYSVLNSIHPKPEESSFLRKLEEKLEDLIRSVAGRWYFTRGVVLFFVLYSLFNLFRVSNIISLYFRLEEFSLTYIEIGQLISTVLSSLMVILGILNIRSSLRAYRFFKNAVLISIFLTQFFDFYSNQLDSITVLFFNIFVLIILQYIIRHTKRSKTK